MFDHSKRDVSVRAECVAMVLPFVSTEETRYYLKGFYVEPVKDGGVILVATDGHMMAVARDETGHADRPWICTLPKTVEKLIIGKRSEDTVHFRGGNVEFGGITAKAEPIDGTFPDWRRIIPPKIGKGAPATFNPGYLERFQKIGKMRSGWPGITVLAQSAADPATVLIEHMPEFYGVLMPMRGSADRAGQPAPDWLGLPKRKAAAPKRKIAA